MTIEHKTIGKLKLTSGTWKSNILIVIAGIVLMSIGGFLPEIVGLILFLIGALNLIVFCFYAITKKK